VAEHVHDAGRGHDDRYRLLFEALDEGIVIIGPDDRIETANPVAVELFARAGITLLGTEVHELARSFVYADGTPMDPPELASDAVRATGLAVGPVVFGITRPGRPMVWVSSTSMPFETDDSGKVVRVLVSAADVTELREAKARAETSEARLAEVLNEARDGIIVLDAGGNVEFANPAACEILGLDAEDLAAITLLDVIVPQQRDLVAADLEAVANGASLLSEYRLSRGEATAWIEVSQAGSSDGMIRAVIRDVTARRLLEDDHRRLVQAVNEAGDAMVLTGLRNRIIYANRTFAQLVDRTPADVIGGDAADYLARLPKGMRLDDLRQILLEGGRWVGEMAVRTAQGVEIPAAVRITLLRSADGEPTGQLILVRDTRPERELQSRLAQSARMEAIGQLAGGVAHDFNNLLTSILGHVEFASETVAADNPARADLEEIQRAAVGAQALTRQLLAVGRRSVLRPRVVDLREFLENVEWILRPLVGQDVSIVVEPGAGLPRIHVDPGMLERAVINLAVNARETMTTGGTITLAAEHEPAKTGAGSVVLRISDTGTGMPQEVADRLFEPFFTARPEGEGAGLALTMVHGFVEQSGGRIEVVSDPALGTSFRLSFPAMSSATPAARPTLIRPETPRRGTGTILVAEDVGVLRAIAERILTAGGYEVLSAPDGPGALAVAAKHAGRIDVLFTDLVMPEMGGAELAAALRATRPEIRVLCTSGYSDEDALRRGIGREWDGFLPKPYTRETVLPAIAELIEATKT
jgi:PAS domain S-box-containing protein